MFLKDTKTGTVFLADSGSVANLMNMETAQRHYPEEWEKRRPLEGNLTGVGGESRVDSLVIISRENEMIPFAVGKKIPLNIIGFQWIGKLQQLESIETQMDDPHSYLSSAAMAVKIGGDDLTENDGRKRHPTPEFRAENTKLPEFQADNMGPECPWAPENQEEGMSQPRLAQSDESNSGQEESLRLDSQGDGDASRSPSRTAENSDGNTDRRKDWRMAPIVRDYVLAKGTPDWVKKELQEIEGKAIALAREDYEPPDLGTKENELIPEEEWRKIYEPYATELEDLRKHLNEPQTMKYKCEIELKDPNTKPFVSGPYNLKGEQQRKALEDGIRLVKQLGVVETGFAQWKLAIFVVPQKMNERQKQNPNCEQPYRVVQNLQPLNAAIKGIEIPPPLIPDVINMAQGRPVLSLLDLKKAYYHVEVPEESRDFLGIAVKNECLRYKKCPLESS